MNFSYEKFIWWNFLELVGDVIAMPMQPGNNFFREFQSLKIWLQREFSGNAGSILQE